MQNENPNYYAILPAVVRYDKTISELAKLLFAEITALSNKFGYCSAGNKYFAELYDKNPQWVSKVIQSLVTAGHIKVVIEGGYLRKIYPLTPYLPIVENIEPHRGKTLSSPRGKAEHNNTRLNTKSNTDSMLPAEADSDSIYPSDFMKFWNLYPKKTGKGDALKSWKKLKPSDKLQTTILISVGLHISSPQWKKDKGRYIPNPATFLNQRRFDDTVEEGTLPDTGASSKKYSDL